MKIWLSILSVGLCYIMALAAFSLQKEGPLEDYNDESPTRHLIRCQCGCDELFDLT